MALVVFSSQAGAPYETYNFSHNSVFSGTTSGDNGNSARGGQDNTTQNFNGSTITNSSSASGINSFLSVDANGDPFGGTTSYTETYSYSAVTTSGETSGSSSSTARGSRTDFVSTFAGTAGAGGPTVSPFGVGSDGNSFELAAATFQSTKFTTQFQLVVSTTTSTETVDYYQLWFLTSEPSNTIGTQLVYTSSAKRPFTDNISSTYSSVISTESTTCPRSHKTKIVVIEDLYQLYEQFPGFDGRDFLFANTSQPSFNTNGLYLVSVVLPTAGGYTTSTEYTFSTTHVNVAGASAASIITFDYPIPDPDQTYSVFDIDYDNPESVNKSQHEQIQYPDALYGQLRLTTRTYTSENNYSRSSSEAALYETSEQVLIQAYGSPDTFRTANPNSDRTIAQTTFFGLNTFQTRAVITGFFGSSNARVPQGFVATATFEQGGVAGDGVISSTASNEGGSTTHAYAQSRAQATNFQLQGAFGGNEIINFQENGGGGAGVKVVFTESAYLDFYLQDPFSKGLSHPLAIELTGGFSDLGMIGAGYSNPANFFNYQDDLIGGIALNEGGNNLNAIQACHRINISGVYAGDEFGNTNASCPPIQNTTASWLSQPTNTTGTSQFITYSFGTSPTYSITTANKRSNPTASITSGTTTKRWATAGAPVSGIAGLQGFANDSYRQSVPLSTFGFTFDPRFNQALVVTDISSNQSSTTRAIRGFLGSDYTPQSVIPFSVTREVGKQKQISVSPYKDDQQLGLYWIGDKVGVPYYRRPHPTSYVGFGGLLANVGGRIAGASIGDLFVGYPFHDVTAQFSDPSF